MLAAWSGDYEQAHKLMQTTLPFVFPFYRPIVGALSTIVRAAAGIDVGDWIDDQVRALRASKPRFARAVEREHTARALLAIAATLSGKNAMAKRLLAAGRKPSRLPLLLREVADLLGDRREDRPVAAAAALEELSNLGFNDLRMLFAPLFQAHSTALDQVGITEAEVAVLRLLAQGLKPKEIAELRTTSVHTIRKQLQNIRVKLNCRGTEQILVRTRALGVL